MGHTLDHGVVTMLCYLVIRQTCIPLLLMSGMILVNPYFIRLLNQILIFFTIHVRRIFNSVVSKRHVLPWRDAMVIWRYPNYLYPEHSVPDTSFIPHVYTGNSVRGVILNT